MQYLEMGFKLEPLCQMLSDKINESDETRRTFVRTLLDVGLCAEGREKPDLLDSERETPYGIGALFLSFFDHSNIQTDERYIPLDECRAILKTCLDCPEIIDECFDAYLEEQSAQPNTPSEGMQEANAEAGEEMKKYDIERLEYLEDYEPGMEIEPELLAQVCEFFSFYDNMNNEARFQEKSAEGLRERFAFLSQAEDLPLRDREWQQIYDDMQTQDYRRYYPVGRIKKNDAVIDILRAILLNDDFYAMIKERIANHDTEPGD